MSPLPDDEKYNSIDNNYREQFDSYSGSNLNQLEKDAATTNNTSSENENSPWVNNTGRSSTAEKQKFSLKSKKSVALISGSAIFGGGAIISFLLAPAGGVMHMAQTYVKDLNDQNTAMQVRSDSLVGGKLKTISSGVCTKVLSVRCKFSTMSKKQVEKFKKAGFVIDETNDSTFGRKRITRMTAPDGTVINNPNDLKKALTSSAEVRSALRKAFNPTFYGLSDKIANKVFTNNKTSKEKKITGNTDEERREALKKATAGEKAGGATGVAKDAKGEYVVDEKGDKVYKNDNPDKFDSLKKSQEELAKTKLTKPTIGGKAVTGVLRSGLTGLSIAGSADTACTVYNTSRGVEAASKVIRSQQLIQFAMVILVTADSIKAGDATPEEVNFIGNMLTQTDTREKIVSEASTVAKESGSTIEGTEIANPFYKKSAFDSPGYKTAAYNDAPVLTSQSLQYTIGGGLVGALAGVNNTVVNLLGGDSSKIRGTCKTVQNPFVRGAGLIAGVLAGIGTLGWSTVVTVGGSVAFGLALPFLEAALADMLAGRIIGDNIAGVEAGDAAFAGTGALLGDMAKNRGMQPLSKEGIKSYTAVTNEVNSDIAKAEAYDARNTPFDIYNQYSFLGSIVSSVYPSLVKFNSGGSGVLSSIGSILSTGFSSLTHTSLAKESFNEQRFSRCNDTGYEDLGIDADIFCNVRYGLTNEELSLDPDEVAAYMISRGYIDEEGNPKDGDYADFIAYCTERKDGWGEMSSDEGGDLETGKYCMDKYTKWSDIKYFRVFTMDSQIQNSMDDGEE